MNQKEHPNNATAAPQAPGRPRFSIRFVLLMMAVVGVCLFTAKNSDWLAGLGLFVAFVLVVGGVFVGRLVSEWPLRTLVWFVCIAAAGAITWFVAVDRFAFMTFCNTCRVHHYTLQYRLLGIPVSSQESKVHDSPMSKIATDLGKPCEHPYEITPQVREWGLVYCWRPCTGGGICCLTSGDENYYERELRERVIVFGERHPDLADEYHRWLQSGDIEEKDYTFYRSFLNRVRSIELNE